VHHLRGAAARRIHTAGRRYQPRRSDARPDTGSNADIDAAATRATKIRGRVRVPTAGHDVVVTPILIDPFAAMEYSLAHNSESDTVNSCFFY
jgi:hypothetical protein